MDHNRITHFGTLHGAYSTEYVMCKSIWYDSMARLAALWFITMGCMAMSPSPVPLSLVGSGFDPVYIA